MRETTGAAIAALVLVVGLLDPAAGWSAPGPGVSGSVSGIVGGATAEAVAVAGAPACPQWDPPTTAGAAPSELPELSGLAPSAVPGRWWTHNDSGDRPRVFEVDGELTVERELAVAVPFVFDVEDIALDPSTLRLWVADIGDNLTIRPTITLFGIDPPAPGAERSVSVAPTTLTLRYPDGARDAESLMIDPRTGDAFIVAKRHDQGRAGVFRISAATLAAPPADPVTLEAVGSIDVSDGGAVGPTAADIDPSGRYVVIKTLTTTYLWPRGRGATVAETLAASPVAPCRIPGAGSNEAIAFALDGRSVVTVAEGIGAPLTTVRRVG